MISIKLSGLWPAIIYQLIRILINHLKYHTNARNFQLGQLIIQKIKQIVLYNIALTSSQKSYTVIEKDLLSIVENLKEFKTILLGKILRIYSDHKNLTCKMFNTDRVLIWRLILEEYSPYIEYIQGDKIQQKTHYQDLPSMVIKRLRRTSPLIKSKLCQK